LLKTPSCCVSKLRNGSALRRCRPAHRPGATRSVLGASLSPERLRIELLEPARHRHLLDLLPVAGCDQRGTFNSPHYCGHRLRSRRCPELMQALVMPALLRRAPRCGWHALALSHVVDPPRSNRDDPRRRGGPTPSRCLHPAGAARAPPAPPLTASFRFWRQLGALARRSMRRGRVPQPQIEDGAQALLGSATPGDLRTSWNCCNGCAEAGLAPIQIRVDRWGWAKATRRAGRRSAISTQHGSTSSRSQLPLTQAEAPAGSAFVARSSSMPSAPWRKPS